MKAPRSIKKNEQHAKTEVENMGLRPKTTIPQGKTDSKKQSPRRLLFLCITTLLSINKMNLISTFGITKTF